MSQFLETQHGFNPETDGASTVANFWLLMCFGAFLGSALLKVLDSKRVLALFGIPALIAFSAAVFGPADVSRYSFMATGFAISVMWPVVFSLALNSLDKHHGTFSGILCTGIVGGAIVPLAIGFVGDHVGLRGGLCLLYLPLLYIGAVSVWAKPLVTNKTVGSSRGAARGGRARWRQARSPKTRRAPPGALLRAGRGGRAAPGGRSWRARSSAL